MSNKLTPPKPEYINIDGEANMVWASPQASAVYAFLEEIARLYNQNIGLSDDPESSTLSYVEYLIVKLKVKQSSGMAGEYLQLHVGQAHLETFLTKMKLETRWRLADGSDTPNKSWLVKGGVNSLPDARGLFLRGYSEELTTQDPDGYSRPLGEYQDSAQQKWSFAINKPIREMNIWGNIVRWNYTGGKTSSPIYNKSGTWGDWYIENWRALRTSTEDRPRNITVLNLILT